MPRPSASKRRWRNPYPNARRRFAALLPRYLRRSPSRHRGRLLPMALLRPLRRGRARPPPSLPPARQRPPERSGRVASGRPVMVPSGRLRSHANPASPGGHQRRRGPLRCNRRRGRRIARRLARRTTAAGGGSVVGVGSPLRRTAFGPQNSRCGRFRAPVTATSRCPRFATGFAVARRRGLPGADACRRDAPAVVRRLPTVRRAGVRLPPACAARHRCAVVPRRDEAAPDPACHALVGRRLHPSPMAVPEARSSSAPNDAAASATTSDRRNTRRSSPSPERSRSRLPTRCRSRSTFWR